MNNEILVSIVCITYNHEKYIRDALKGFVMQKTDFKFEVIVHDDASTDGTAKIIEEYATKYEFIKPILQTENKYSQNVAIGRTYIYPIVRGKYIAYCEGDDYWTDERKLQRLIDYMESHTECSICCHAYTNITAEDKKELQIIEPLSSEGNISMEQAIKYYSPPQLASQIVRTSVVLAMPEFCNSDKVGVGDYPLLVWGTAVGENHYMPYNMTHHRIAAKGSWTERVSKNANKSYLVDHYARIKAFLDSFDEYTKLKYHDLIEERNDEITYMCAIMSKKFAEAKRCKFYAKKHFIRKAIINIGCVMPGFAAYLDKCAQKLITLLKQSR